MIKNCLEKLLIPLLSGTLFACTNSAENSTLSCYGTKITTGTNISSSADNFTKKFKLKNNIFEDYSCAEINHIIKCDATTENNEHQISKSISYDTKSLSFSEVISTWNSSNKGGVSSNLISRIELIGNCDKLLF
jgi:hypothetical protein